VETRRGQSFANWSEANLILRKLQELEEICRQHQWQPTVGVISGYFAQVEQLRREIDPDNASRWRQLQLEIATVDSFQGRECDVVIYSTVRSNQARQIGFLKDYRRINVALSRARDSLVIVGDDFMMRNATIGSDDNPFATVLEHLRSHPDECSIVPYSER
jgi:superfamily I DNA and/or RNA helicase